jgi:zinc transporter ZupT
VIATAFSSSISLGILTSLAVIAHEIPQELGDFLILIESGWERWSAYWWNFLSSLATFAGAVVASIAVDFIAPQTPYFLTIAAASFLYIAMVDLGPVLHHDSGLKTSLRQLPGLGRSGNCSHFFTGWDKLVCVSACHTRQAGSRLVTWSKFGRWLRKRQTD